MMPVAWRPYALITLVYSMAWGLMLLNTQGIYWDGWVLVQHDLAVVWQRFRQAGTTWGGASNVVLLAISDHPAVVFRTVVFVCYAIVAMVFYALLRRMGEVLKQLALPAALLLAAMPLNPARVAIIDAAYAQASLFFFVAFLALYKDCQQPAWRWRGMAVLFFALSFEIASFLLFYMAPMLAMWYWSGAGLRRSALFRLCRERWLYLMLPVLVFAVKRVFFQPYGLYQNYNKIDPLAAWQHGQGLLYAGKSVLEAWFQVWDGGLFLLAVVPLLALLSRLPIPRLAAWSVVRILWLPVLLLALAIIPYWLVGKLPSMTGWSSRHQLLLPYGLAILLAALIYLFPAQRVRQGVLIALLAVAVAASQCWLLHIQAGAFKQEALMGQLARLPALQGLHNRLILVRDRCTGWNAVRRPLTFYEYSGLMRRALHADRGLLVVDMAHAGTAAMLARRYRQDPSYNIAGYDNGPLAGGLVLSGCPAYSPWQVVSLLFDRSLRPGVYADRVQGLMQVSWLGRPATGPQHEEKD